MQLFIGNIIGNTAELTEEESRHYSKVLRGKIGQEILVTDGKGIMAKGVVSQISSKSVMVDLTEIQSDYEKKTLPIAYCHCSHQKHGPNRIFSGKSD